MNRVNSRSDHSHEVSTMNIVLELLFIIVVVAVVVVVIIIIIIHGFGWTGLGRKITTFCRLG